MLSNSTKEISIETLKRNIYWATTNLEKELQNESIVNMGYTVTPYRAWAMNQDKLPTTKKAIQKYIAYLTDKIDEITAMEVALAEIEAQNTK